MAFATNNVCPDLIFWWEKYPSLQLSQKNVFYHLLLVSFIVRKFLWKKSFEKMFSCRKTKLLLSPLDFCSIFFFESKNSFLVFNCSFDFLRLCFSLFSFSVWFFLVSFIFFLNLCKEKSSKKISRKYKFFFKSLNFFWEEGTYFWCKINVQKNHLNFLQKKKLLQRKEKTYFKIHTRWGSRARLKALLTIAACRDVVERVQSMCIQLSFISAADICCIKTSLTLILLFFFSLKKKTCEKMLCSCLSLPFCSLSNFSNTFLTSLLRLFFKIKNFMAENSFFLFSFSCFILMFPVLFCLSLYFCQGDLMTEDNTRHQEKWVKPMVTMVTNVWKGGFLLACFSAWTKVSVDGPDSTKENALAENFRLGLAALVCFLWLSDLCVTQTARGTSAGECLSSSPFVFSLSIFTLFMFTLRPQHLAKSYWKDWATLRRWGWT